VEDFAAQVADLDYPMAVVTAAAGGEPSGCLVGFLTQCSIHPPRLVVFISSANHTHGVALRATHLGVHWLSTRHTALAELFGSLTGDQADKFSRCRWEQAEGGAPVIADCPRWLVGRVLDRRAHGDHTGFVVEPVSASCGQPWPRQLGYQDVKDLHPGHRP